MKKSFRRITPLFFSIVLVMAFTSCAKDISADIDALLAPYQEVIDAVNAEVEPDFFIPEEDKETMYNHYKDYTLEEFEQELRESHAEALKELEGVDDYFFVDPEFFDAASGKDTTEEIDTLLAPYQEVIDAVNAELSPDFLITEDKKEAVYNHYKNYTLEEFEQELRDKHAKVSKNLEGFDGYILVGAEFVDAASGEE